MRQSTALADRMPLDDFLAMVNDYFESTAGAVLDHGGEVLRFIGDAVIAIFPFEAERRPMADMARAAVATAREAAARIERRNASLAAAAHEPIRYGISLHVGSVLYGNIGTNDRLEFSVVGPAANEVVRLESLCKTLGATLVASERFAALYPEEMIYLGAHPVAGLEKGLEAHTLPDFRPEASV